MVPVSERDENSPASHTRGFRQFARCSRVLLSPVSYLHLSVQLYTPQTQDAQTPICSIASLQQGFCKLPPRLLGLLLNVGGGSPPCLERGEFGLFTLASCSPRPRGTSRSFSLSSLLPSSRTGIRSPTASCRTDHPSTERSLPR